MALPLDWFRYGWHPMLGLGIVVTASTWIGLMIRRASFMAYLAAVLQSPFLVLAGLILGTLFQWALDRAGTGGAIRTYLPVLVFPALGFVAGRTGFGRRPSAGYARGTVIQDAGALRRALGGAWRRDSQGLTLAGVPIPALDETKHFKLIGTTGTGKSSAIREVLRGALGRGDRAIIADPDGGYLQRFYDPQRGDVILNPFDTRSVRWDLFREIRNPYDFEQLARSLIGESSGQDRIWRQYAQTYFAALLRQTHGLGAAHMADFHRLLTRAPAEELRLLLDGTAAEAFLQPGNEKMFGSIHAVTRVHTSALEYIQAQRSPLFSIRDWVRQGTGVLFLPYQPDQIAALKYIISTWMRIAIFEAMSLGEGDHRLWFVIDELDALGAIDGLKDALTRLRKYGGRCVLGFQSIAQVRGTYGDAEAQTIVENCGNTLILRCSASESGGTAQFASRLIGEREIVRQQITENRSGGFFETPQRSVSRSEQHATESAVLASQVEQLPDLSGYLKFASLPVWRRVSIRVG